MMRRTGTFVFLVFLQSVACLAQLRGKIVEVGSNADTLPLPGVTVLWENTTMAVMTDEKGGFSIAVPSARSRLHIKALGYGDRYAQVTDTSKRILLVMKSNAELKEVEVVYYSSGTEITMLNPIKVETLNERSLMKAACCNLSESFETNPGIDVNFSDAVSGAKQIQMLGLSGQYAQITKENMPYMRGLAGNYGLSFIPGPWIQSIQLSKGAGSVINGYESFTGQINTELQNPEHSDKLHFNTYVNQNGRNEYNLNLARPLGPSVSAGLLSHISFNPLAEDQNKDRFTDIPTGRQYNFINKYDVHSKKGFEAQFGGGYLRDERNGGQNAGGGLNDTVVPYLIGINNEKWEAYSKTGYIFKKRPGTSVGLQMSYLNHDQHNKFGQGEYNGNQRTFYANLIYQGIFGNTNHSYRTGFSFLNDEVKEQFRSLKYGRQEIVPGAFFEYSMNLSEKFNLIAGVRADRHNYYGVFATPRLHLRYAFTPTSVLRLSGGRALRTANIFADNAGLMVSSRTWTIETSDSTMPYGLQPETGYNFGCNFTRKFKINYREAYVTFDLYRTEFTQQVVVDVDRNAQQAWFYNLKGPSYTNSAQFEFSMEPRKRFFVKTAYRYVDNRVNFKQGLLQKVLVSEHRAFINLSYETRNNHWQFDFTTQYNGPKRLPGTDSNPVEYQRAHFSPAYYNVLGQITWLTKVGTGDFHFYVGVENLLDYHQPAPIVSADNPYGKFFDASMVWGPIYGRMLYAGLRLKFK
jgi:outer membrane receptor for ferrienterochelin and colicins